MSDDTELVIPSLFVENDWKRHMSINLETGLWRCFKSGEAGNFVKLFSLSEGCTYRDAYERLIFEDFISNGDFKKRKVYQVINPNNITTYLDETENFTPIKNGPHKDFIKSRMMDSFDFFVAKGGRYDDRLIIPFVNRKGKIFYFQGRSLGSQRPKYLNCKNLKSSQILYPFDYDSVEPLYITEGVFDCLSLKLLGYNATTTLSCFTSREQMLQLSQYRGPLVCCFDSDEAGIEGMKKFVEVAYWANFDNLLYCKVPNGRKDWNEVLVGDGPDRLLEAARELYTLNLTTIEMLKLTV